MKFFLRPSQIKREFRASAVLLFCALIGHHHIANAQNGADLSSQVERRIALVIGNGTYSEAPLPNALNDARLVAASLKALDLMLIM